MAVEVFRAKNKPNFLSQCTLELTFRILRKKEPSLALEVQNQLVKGRKTLIALRSNRQPLSSSPQPLYLNHIKITLRPQSVGKIVEALTRAGQYTLDKAPGEKGQLAIIRKLIYQWIALTESIILNSLSEVSVQHSS